MRWRLKSMWRYLSAINNDDGNMRSATGPYRLLRPCDLSCFPLAFKDSRMESEYRDFNVRRMPVRLLIMLPILSAIYVVSYVTARQFCPSCYLAPAFEGEIAVSISFLALATLGAHLYFLYEHLELFIAVLLCLVRGRLVPSRCDSRGQLSQAHMGRTRRATKRKLQRDFAKNPRIVVSACL